MTPGRQWLCSPAWEKPQPWSGDSKVHSFLVKVSTQGCPRFMGGHAFNSEMLWQQLKMFLLCNFMLLQTCTLYSKTPRISN